ncbi:MAG TPA: universal stress protein [Acidimicrobiales bacterium]|nr:universal stress protein [Acidimicrobiales bacterium]
MFKVVVVGADDSPTARRAVEAATEMAAMSNGELHIVTAYSTPVVRDGHLPSEFRHLSHDGDIDAVLQVLSFIPKKRGIEPTLHSVTGDPAEAIIKKATELKADLVVVGNRGMRGVRRVLGSVPNTVAHGAPCSVAIIDTSE